MKSHIFRLGLIAAPATMGLVLLLGLGALLKSSQRPPAIQAVFGKAPVEEALIITRVISPETVPAAQLSGNRVRVTGIIQCTADQTLLLRATVTQGAVEAIGEAQYVCTGHIQRWVIDVVTSDGVVFVSGEASVHVWSQTLEDGDVHEWDSIARLVGPP